MSNKSNYEYLLSDLTKLKGVGTKTTNLLKKKKINNIFDLLWKLPKSYTDRSRSIKIKDLKIGENQKSIAILEKMIIDLKPKTGKAEYLLGINYLQLEESKLGCNYLQKSKEKGFTFPQAILDQFCYKEKA